MNSTSIEPLHISGEHSYHRRAIGHDYFAPFIYHIIFKKNGDCGKFSHIVGDARIEPGHPGCANISETELGVIIAKAIIHLPYTYPSVKPLQFVVMPDHVHLILQVLYRTNRHLKLNPHRLAMRLQYPQFFQRVRKLKIGDEEFEAYGNLFLFRNPDKVSVKISRKFTVEEKAKLKASWLWEASGGTVLVSPFISQEEKAIRVEAEAGSASIILITHEIFPERFKPAAHDFNLCTGGRLLIISLGLPPKTPLTREICQRMNALQRLLPTQLHDFIYFINVPYQIFSKLLKI